MTEQPSLNSPLKSFPGLSLHKACRILPAVCHVCVLFRFHDSYVYGLLPHTLNHHFYLLLLGGVRPKPNEGRKGNFKHCSLALIHIQVILNNFFFVSIIVMYIGCHFHRDIIYFLKNNIIEIIFRFKLFSLYLK